MPRLRPDIVISIEYSDETEFGGPLSSKLKENLDRAFSKVHQVIQSNGAIYMIQHSQELLEGLLQQEDYIRLVEEIDHKKIKLKVLYPEKNLTKPVALNLFCTNDDQKLRIEFHPSLLPAIHDLIAVLYGNDFSIDEPSNDIIGLYQRILFEMNKRNLLLPADSDAFTFEDRNRFGLRSCDATFVGHATAIIRSESTQVIVDPWFFPTSKNDPEDYQPMLKSEIGKIDAILITHSHPDHFVPGTLIQFNKKTKILVPKVDNESLLSIDMVFRLKQIGFEDIQTVEWWEEIKIGDIQIIALPFYGEQPTTSDQLYPEIRMVGNTYLIKSPRISYAFIADSGRDRNGDIREVALEAYRRWGRVDILFTGYRGWNLYPIQYVKSSVPWYLLFVPPELYTARQSIMNSQSEAVDTAEIWHASYIVPYADGGAPWYSRIGLGPNLTNINTSEHKEWPFFDPLPESCIEELRLRSAPTPDSVIGSPVLPLLLRPGQSIKMIGDEPQIVKSERHNAGCFKM